MSTHVSNAQIATRSSSVRRSNRRSRSRRAMVCVSAATPGSANRTSVAAEIVGAILKFPPLWEAASKGAKEKMVKRAGELGIEWEAEVNQLRSAADWEQALKDATDPEVVENMPAYYKTSFHAYPEGNLGWDPALEVEVAAKAVQWTTAEKKILQGRKGRDLHRHQKRLLHNRNAKEKGLHVILPFDGTDTSGETANYLRCENCDVTTKVQCFTDWVKRKCPGLQ